MKKVRQRKIVELVEQYEIDTQEELANRLSEAGYEVTQATVSRDIRELKLSKVSLGNGRQKYVVYRQDDSSHMEDKYIRVLRDGFAAVNLAQSILVVRTGSGMAMAVAMALDAMKLPEIVGCIAGDDTIMIAVRNLEDSQKLMEKINSLLEK